VQTVRYGPYGENTNTSGTVAYSTTNDPFLFQGGYHTSGGNAGTGNVEVVPFAVEVLGGGRV